MDVQSEFEQTKNQLVDDYKKIGMLSIAPLWLSYNLITTESSKTGGYDFSGGFRMLGWLTLPGTLLLTPIALGVSAVGGVCNTGWGAFALSRAAYRDAHKVTEEHSAEQSKNTAISHQLMNKAMPSVSNQDAVNDSEMTPPTVFPALHRPVSNKRDTRSDLLERHANLVM
jgi:hypothetical protein